MTLIIVRTITVETITSAAAVAENVDRTVYTPTAVDLRLRNVSK